MPYTTRGSQKYSVSSAPGEGGAAEASGDHANDPLAIGGPFDDGDTGSDAEATPTETPDPARRNPSRTALDYHYEHSHLMSTRPVQ